jgi:hypothetical protein
MHPETGLLDRSGPERLLEARAHPLEVNSQSCQRLRVEPRCGRFSELAKEALADLI